MVDYNRLQDTAQKLLAKYGSTWTHRRIIKSTYNPYTNSRSVVSTTDTLVKAVSVQNDIEQVNGEVIQQGDIKLIVEAKNFSSPPSLQDIMVDGSYVWQILAINEIKPASLVICYEMWLRQ